MRALDQVSLNMLPVVINECLGIAASTQMCYKAVGMLPRSRGFGVWVWGFGMKTP